jgi:hypothetical protein
MIRGRDGQLFDITPLGSERDRVGMRFVPHIGTDQEFTPMKKSGIFIECPKQLITTTMPNDPPHE